MSGPRCRSCRATDGDVVLDLGLQPACEYFPEPGDPAADAVFPLRLWLCARCGLAQLADDAILPDEPEGVEPTALIEQRHDAVAAARAAGLLPAGATVIEGATPHGGSWRGELAELGLQPVAAGTRADVVVDGSFGMMHAADQAAALDDLVAQLQPDGTLILQFHTLAAILREQQWNAVRLGHYAYYSVPALRNMVEQRGLTVIGTWEFPLYGGTVMLAARRHGESDASVDALTAAELAAGVQDPGVVAELQACVDVSIAALRRLTQDARAGGSTVYGYSAASRAVSLVYLAGLQDDLLRGVADASPAKHGRRMPGTAIPVLTPADLVAARPDLVLLFVSDLLPEVRRALPEIEAGGGRWIDAGIGLPDAS